jgi:hypothetical protein
VKFSDFLVNGSMLKTMAALLVFLLTLGAAFIVGFCWLSGREVPQQALYELGAALLICAHQLGFVNGASSTSYASATATDVAGLVAQIVPRVITPLVQTDIAAATQPVSVSAPASPAPAGASASVWPKAWTP